MSSIQYSSVLPDNNRSGGYTSQDVVNFTLNNGGRSLVLGSVKLEGKLRVNTNANVRATNQDIRFNPYAGSGSFLDGVNTSSANNGTLENIQFDYGRYLNMVAKASTDRTDHFSSNAVCELKAPFDTMTSEYCYGVVTTNNQNPETDDIDFSHKLKICLNRQVQGSDLPFSRTGFMRLSITLARDASAMYGLFRTDANINMSSVNYVLSDLKIVYQTVPDVGQKDAVVMRSLVPLKSTLESDFSNVSSSVPAKVDAVSISYQFQERENRVLNDQGNPQVWDNYAMNKIPNFQSIQYIFNNSQSEYISYLIENESEAIKRGIESLSDTGHNQVSLDALNSQDVLLHGISLGEMIDFSAQQFSVQINAPNGLSSNNAMVIYMFFHSLVTA